MDLNFFFICVSPYVSDLLFWLLHPTSILSRRQTIVSRSTSKVRVLCEDWKVDGVNLLQELAANLVSTAYRPLAYAHLLCVGNHFQRVLGSRFSNDLWCHESQWGFLYIDLFISSRLQSLKASPSRRNLPRSQKRYLCWYGAIVERFEMSSPWETG